MKKWLTVAVRGLHLVVPYAALALSLAGHPDCAALLGGLVDPSAVQLPPS